MRYRIEVEGLTQFATTKFAAKIIATALNLVTHATARIYENGSLVAVIDNRRGCWEVLG